MKGVTVWFTGLPCSGKTTLALKLSAELKKRGILCEDLDGDITRKYLSKGLGFSKEDRDENIRRVGFVCSLLTKHGAVTTAAFVSPYRSIRAEIREMIGNFVEVYVKCSLDKCIERDVKGMYKKAIAGEIKNFTGISDPFEEPEKPELVIESDKESEDESLKKLLDKLEELGYLQPGRQGHRHPRLPAPGPGQDPGQPEFPRPAHVRHPYPQQLRGPEQRPGRPVPGRRGRGPRKTEETRLHQLRRTA